MRSCHTGRKTTFSPPPNVPFVPDTTQWRLVRLGFSVLCTVLDGQLLVLAKLRLADLVYIPKGTANRQTHFNRIQSKQVDFVLCTRDIFTPVLVIELDDASHEEEARSDRDTFVDAALAAAGLPILHIPAQKSYVPAEIAAAVRLKLQ